PATAGTKNNTATVTSTNGGPGADATASLTVRRSEERRVGKECSPASILLNAQRQLTFSVTNPNTIPLNGVGISDTFPQDVKIVSPIGFSATGPCAAGLAGFAVGSGPIAISLSPMAPGVTCTFSATVPPATAGTKNNTATVTSTNGGPGADATASLTVR